MQDYPEQDLINTYKFVQAVKDQCNKGIDNCKTPEQIQQEIAEMCLDCFLPSNIDCEICQQGTTQQLALNFEVIDEEIVNVLVNK